MRLLVYTPSLTPRVQYVWEVLLRYLLKVDFELTNDRNSYQRADAARINYSRQQQSSDEVFIPAGNLLLESDIRPQAIELFTSNDLPAFFAQNITHTDFPFDLPAMVFYLISRYEEYLPYQKDIHGRFPALESLAYKTKFLRQPIVNQWACQLRIKLLERFPALELPALTYRFQPTYDVDMAWAYRYKGWQRNIGGGLNDLIKGHFKEIGERIQVLFGKQEDPFYTFSYLDQLHWQYHLQPIYFFLLGNHGIYDKNISHERPALRALIQSMHQHHAIGIHPSYGSDGQADQIGQEVRRLKEITDDPVVRSRQHFLLLHLPGTYRHLLDNGITSDYTMGFAAEIGFRAGIATPYPWYDLGKEEATLLIVHPFQVMDVTLKNYLQLSPKAAIDTVQQLIEATKAVGGTFSTIWHNSSFSSIEDWDHWREVYETIVRMAVA